MSNLTYWEKLRDPQWQRLRLEAMQKANFTCELCMDSKSPLNVHHKEYFKGHEPWEYEVAQLAVLCESCHESHHDEFNLLKWLCSYAPLNGSGSRINIAYLIAGFLSADYEGVLSISCHEHSDNKKVAHDLGIAAREKLNG